MIRIENVDIHGWEAAIRGMRNPKNSWDKSDSCFGEVGDADLALMQTLATAGNDHGKFLRMINVTMDITTMQPWWAEFDTYKVGTVRNSCSKMHKIHVKQFHTDDISHEGCDQVDYAFEALLRVLAICEKLRRDYNRTGEKKYWRALIELLPEGYNMCATVQVNYAVLRAMYHARKHHKLDEWKAFCNWIETLPYAQELIVYERV